jgi:hypothetical protein
MHLLLRPHGSRRLRRTHGGAVPCMHGLLVDNVLLLLLLLRLVLVKGQAVRVNSCPLRLL